MTSLTALLDSLHSHLQTQTRLLPTLHAQLGLPQSALQEELNALKDHLIQSVDSQVDKRRKEVDDWMRKCSQVEEGCNQYYKALGGHVKATGSTMGELRKEQILPRRFELVSEHQEKLRQLYHTKLEQLTTLTNRLNALDRTLGSPFFAPDILTLDSEEPLEVTPERFLKLEKELVRGKSEVSKRLAQLAELFSHIDWLYTELGMTPPSSDSSYPPSPCDNDPFLASTSTPTPSSRSRATSLFAGDRDADEEYYGCLSRFISVTASTESSSIPASALEGVEPTPSIIAWATNLLASLTETKRKRERRIQAMYDQLETLWRRLGVADEDMDAFVDVNRGSTEECVHAYEEELERMLDVKRERMGEFVTNARDEICKLWEELMVGEEERRDFAPFADSEFTEELLSIHETEVQRLKDEKRVKGPLLASIKKYFDICEEERELAAAASDQSRLLGRGAGGSRDPGRLLREEKMRRRVKKEKPKLEQDLLSAIPAWELETGKPFLVHGESVLQILMETVSAADQENAIRRSKSHSRSGSGSGPGITTSRAKTPVGHSGGKGIVTPAVRSSSSMSNGRPESSNKRARLGENNQDSSRNPGTGSRAPLQDHRGQQRSVSRSRSGRSVSPTKIPGKTSLPRHQPPPPVPSIAMPIPRTGTQHHSLGHGKVPSVHPGSMSNSVGSSTRGFLQTVSRSTSSSTSTYGSSQRLTRGPSSSTLAVEDLLVKKAQKVRRESFKPRPSTESSAVPGGLKWTNGLGAGYVKEEADEDY